MRRKEEKGWKEGGKQKNEGNGGEGGEGKINFNLNYSGFPLLLGRT